VIALAAPLRPLLAAALGAPPELIYRLAIGVLGAALAISVVSDLRARLIYNWVTLPALAIELGLAALASGWPGLGWSIVGMLVCAGPLALGSMFGAMGMGDVKLMAVVGAVAGWPASLPVLFIVSVAGGLQAAGQLLYARARGHKRPKYVPYGVAIAAGTLATWAGMTFFAQ